MLTGQILLLLFIILVVGQLLGYLCKLIGQQQVIAEILTGLALGPSLLGAIWPHLEMHLFPVSVLPTLQTLGDIGLVLYMFSLGTRLDVHSILHQSRKAVVVSLSGMLLPLVMGAATGLLLYSGFAGPQATPLAFVLLVGTAMSITAFPVLARLLVERGMLNTNVGMLALTSASIDDVLAWCLLAFAIASIHSHGLMAAGLTILETLAFTGMMLFGVRPGLNYLVRRTQSIEVHVAVSLIILLFASYITNAIGVHPIFGAFIAGIILPRNGAFVSQIRSLDRVNNFLFLPLFFVSSGLKTQIGLIQSPTLLLVCLLIILVACSGKIGAATCSARLMGDRWRDSFSLGVLMNTRGLVELIVLNVGLQLGILSPTLFAMLTVMAVVTTMMAAPLLWLLGYRMMDKTDAHDEKVESETVSSVSS